MQSPIFGYIRAKTTLTREASAVSLRWYFGRKYRFWFLERQRTRGRIPNCKMEWWSFCSENRQGQSGITPSLPSQAIIPQNIWPHSLKLLSELQVHARSISSSTSGRQGEKLKIRRWDPSLTTMGRWSPYSMPRDSPHGSWEVAWLFTFMIKFKYWFSQNYRQVTTTTLWHASQLRPFWLVPPLSKGTRRASKMELRDGSPSKPPTR